MTPPQIIGLYLLLGVVVLLLEILRAKSARKSLLDSLEQLNRTVHSTWGRVLAVAVAIAFYLVVWPIELLVIGNYILRKKKEDK